MEGGASGGGDAAPRRLEITVNPAPVTMDTTEEFVRDCRRFSGGTACPTLLV